MSNATTCTCCHEAPAVEVGRCHPCYEAQRTNAICRHFLRAERNFIRDGVGVLTTPTGVEHIVDLEDFERCRMTLWADDTGGYAMGTPRGTTGRTKLHRWLMPGVSFVDHIDRDKRNNRRSNLRDGGGGLNQRNVAKRAKTGFKGVYANGPGRFQAKGSLNGVVHYLGTFSTPVEAASVLATWGAQLGLSEFYPMPRE